MKTLKIPVLITLLLTGCGSNQVTSTSSNYSSSKNSSSTTSSNQIISSSIELEKVDLELPVFIGTQSGFQIDRNIYGTFIEHIDTCIYNGIWSEMIMDRKFHDPVATGVSQWSKNGDVENNQEVYKSAPYATTINKDGSITQLGIPLDENKDYDGYFYACGNGNLTISFTNADETIERKIEINSDTMTKYEYKIHSNVKNRKTKIIIKSDSNGIVVDSLSLMPSDNYYGMRKDSLDLLKSLNAPFYRWPGGNFVSGYDWKDGIGDRDERQSKRNLEYCGLESDFENEDERLANDIIKIGSLGFYGAFEPNDYGLDEFIMMCRYLNAEPNIVVNSGLGNALDAADEVEYCNTTNTEYGNKRVEKEPYNVKYWSIGNEMNGSWQLGNVPINEYIVRHNEFYSKMKEVDNTIKIIGVGDNHSNWSKDMLNNTEMDYISEHFYAERDEKDSITHIRSLQKQAEYRIDNHRKLNKPNVYMSIDEYAYMNAECSTRLKDGMGVALCLNEFIKNADVVKIGCYSSTVNATQGSLTTDKYGAHMQGNGYALKLYSDSMLDYYQPITFQRSKLKDEVFEIIGTTNIGKDKLAIAVVNSGEKKIRLTNDKFKKIESRKYVTADFLDDYDDDEYSKFRYYEENNPSSIVVEPRSITTFVIQL